MLWSEHYRNACIEKGRRMKKSAVLILLCLSAFALGRISFGEEAKPDGPENLARQATATASSEYSGGYMARYAIDGIVPEADLKDDVDRAWATKGAASADFTLTWSVSVELSELIYFGRCGFAQKECWNEYEIYFDDETTPAISGMFEARPEGQRVAFEKRTATSVRFHFLSSHGGPNSGASEIMAFADPLTERELTRITAGPPPEIPDWMPNDCRRMIVLQRHAMNPSHVYTYHTEGFRPGGALWMVDFGQPDEFGEVEPTMTKLLDSPDGQLLDVDLSYDGREILFSWKQGGREYGEQFNRSLPPDLDPSNMYKIYRMNLDTQEITELTDGTSNNFNASWLPDGGIAFLSDRKPAFAYCFVTTSPVLYRMNADGSDPQCLSANYLNDFTPHVMHDGRIMYSRWEYVDRPAIPMQSLWSINPDGTGLSGVFGNRALSPATFMEARSIPGGNKILCVLTSHNGPCRGAIGILDRSIGPNSQEAITNLTPEVNIGLVNQGNGNRVRGPYENPLPLDDEFYLVSRAGTVQLRDYAGQRTASLLTPSGGLGYYSPTPIRETSRPPVMPSNLPFVEDNELWATLTMRDVYVGLEPHVKRGEIKQLAIVQEVEKSRWAPQSSDGSNNIAAFGFQFPLVSCGATYAPKRLWGFATVEEDGSAHFKVPAGLPIYFMAIDAEGRALQRMRSFTHLMPGERQGCVGCHADRNTVLSVNSQGRSELATAFRRPAEDLIPAEWGDEGRFSFHRVVQPVLDEHCVECHNARSMAGDVDLSADKTDFFNVAYEHLARKGTIGAWQPTVHGLGGLGQTGKNPYVSWISTYNGEEENILEVTPKYWGSPASLLADLVRAGHPDENGEARVDLPSDAQRRIFTWIDLNAPYYSTSVSNHYDKIGCRRLYPDQLDAALQDVATRRCAECHENGVVPREFYTRVDNPQDNSFLLAPLAKAAGGTETCGRAVFESTDDSDYRTLLELFDPIHDLLNERPRMDMLPPGSGSIDCDLITAEY
jgi:hypothetical protein